MNQNSTLLEFIKSKEAKKSQEPEASLEPRPMLGGWEVQGEGADQLKGSDGPPISRRAAMFDTSVSLRYGPRSSELIEPARIEEKYPSYPSSNKMLSPPSGFNQELAETAGGSLKNPLKKTFDYFFGAPTPEEAQNILKTQPTDPAQRARLQRTATGNGEPSDLTKAGSYLFGQPDQIVDQNILGAQPQLQDPFGVTEKQIAEAGNTNFGRRVPDTPFRSQYGVNSLGQDAISEIQAQGGQIGKQPAPNGASLAQPSFGGLTTAGGQGLSEFLAGGQQLDAQGRMIDPNVDRSSFEQESAAREARIDQRADFGKAISDRDRRAARGEGMSDADRRDIAKANAPGASASDIARGGKVAELNRVDRKTGKPLAQEGAMTRAEDLAERKFQAELAENNRAWETAQADKAAETAAGVQETAQARQKTVERMDSQLSFLKNSAIEMAGLQDWSTEGFSGWVAEKLPFDTAAAQVNRLATSFQGNAFLRSIIDSKSLGATFGALSDNEGNKITAAETTLMDTKMGNEARMRAAKQIIDTIESAKSRAMKEQGWSSGSTNAPRYFDDQDDGVKVETYYQG